MADTKQISLKLTVDSKQAEAILARVNGLVDQLRKGDGSDNLKAAVNFENLTNKIKQTKEAAEQLPPGMRQGQLAITQLGYVLNDSAVFATNFRMGLMGIGNNIPMVVQALQNAREEVKATGGSMKDVLLNSIKGPGGLILGINALMLALQFLPGLFKQGTDAVKEQKKAMDELKNTYNEATKAYIESQVKKLQADKQQYVPLVAKGTNLDPRIRADYESKIAGIEKQIADLNSVLYGRGTIAEQELNRKILEDIKKSLNPQQFSKGSLATTQYLQKQFQIDYGMASAIGKAGSYEEAIRILDNAIKSLENTLNPKTGGAKQGGKSTVLEALELMQKQEQLAGLESSGAGLFGVQLVNLEKISLLLKNQNLTIDERIGLLEYEKRLQESVYGLKGDIKSPGVGSAGSIKGQPYGGITDKGYYQKTTTPVVFESQEMLGGYVKSWFEVGGAAEQAAQQTASAWTATIKVFKNANSVLENLLNLFVQIIIQQALTRAISGIFSVAGGKTFSDGFFGTGQRLVTPAAISAGVGTTSRVVNLNGEFKIHGSDLKSVINRQNIREAKYR